MASVVVAAAAAAAAASNTPTLSINSAHILSPNNDATSAYSAYGVYNSKLTTPNGSGNGTATVYSGAGANTSCSTTASEAAYSHYGTANRRENGF